MIIFKVLSAWAQPLQQVHLVHLLNADWALDSHQPLDQADLGCESTGKGRYYFHPHCDFFTITQPVK